MATTGNNIDKPTLLDIHKAQLQNDYNNNHQKDNIVGILGGIDNILTLVLSSSDIILSNDQINEIHDAIYKPDEDTDNDDENDDDIDENSENGAIEDRLTFTFNRNNTFLHYIFGDEMAQKIKEIMLSKYSFIILVGTFVLYILSWISMEVLNYEAMFIIIYRLLFDIFVSIYAIAIILSVNKRCCFLILKEFTFWLKTLYVLQLAIFAFIYEWYKDRLELDNTLLIMIEILESFLALLVIVCVSFVDAFKAKIWTKIIGGMVLATWLTYLSINYLFLDEIIMKISVASISVGDMIQSSAQLLALFIWTQTFLLFRSDGRCVLIKYSPYIIWNKQISNKIISNDSKSNGTNLTELIQPSIDLDDFKRRTWFVNDKEHLEMLQLHKENSEDVGLD